MATLCILLSHAELEQLKKGLHGTLQLESFIYSYAREMHYFLAASTNFDVTCDYLLDSMMIRYSDHGSNNHTAEEAVILHWTDYVTECSDTYVCSCTSIMCSFTSVLIALHVQIEKMCHLLM